MEPLVETVRGLGNRHEADMVVSGKSPAVPERILHDRHKLALSWLSNNSAGRTKCLNISDFR